MQAGTVRAIFALLLAACSRGAGDAGNTTRIRDTGAMVNADAAPTVSPTAATCIPTGFWTACAVFQRLDRVGLAPRADSGRIAVPPFTVPAQRLHVGTSDLDVFIYKDVAARQSDERKLDRTKFVEYDAPLGMQALPTIIRSTNLIAVLHSRNDHQRERVSDALTAGPPQP